MAEIFNKRLSVSENYDLEQELINPISETDGMILCILESCLELENPKSSILHHLSRYKISNDDKTILTRLKQLLIRLEQNPTQEDENDEKSYDNPVKKDKFEFEPTRYIEVEDELIKVSSIHRITKEQHYNETKNRLEYDIVFNKQPEDGFGSNIIISYLNRGVRDETVVSIKNKLKQFKIEFI